MDYALIGNCQVSALIDRVGRYVWACMPRLDSSSVFGSLLGGDLAGFFQIAPESPFETRQRYRENTNVAVTEFYLKNGNRFDVIDFAPRYAHQDRHFKPPRFIRIVRLISGNPRVRVICKPKFDYGKLEPEAYYNGKQILYRTSGDLLFLDSEFPATFLLNGQPFELVHDQYFVWSYGEPFMPPLKSGCEESYERTVHYWRTWVKNCNIPFEYQNHVIRSALALKLHIFEDTGAIIASTTTSIPESSVKDPSKEGARTWDYRYCWLRDSYFVIRALNRLGQFEETERFIHFLHMIAVNEPGQDLQPVYGIDGEKKLEEIERPDLAGFLGIKPVRIGNAAYTHVQYDVYGEMVLAVARLFFDRRLDRTDLDRVMCTVVQLVEQAIFVSDKPDSGIWEFRSERKHYLFSKLMCWAAVDRGIKIAEKMGKGDSFLHWKDALIKIRSEIENQGWNESLGIYTQTYRSETPDAANLLMLELGFEPADSLRFKKMVQYYERDLMRNGYVFRYRNRDDFGVPHNAFLICTFWMIDALVAIGKKEDARSIFERVLARANHVGLLSEDADPDTGELWGNFPQAYSHVGVINSAFKLSRAWDEGF